MAEGRGGAGWVAAVAGLLAVALGVWMLRSSEPDARNEESGPSRAESAPAASPAEAEEPSVQEVVSGEARIPSQGRIRLSGDSLPKDAPLSLVLELPEETRMDGPAAAKVISAGGRRLDLTASPEADAGLRLEVDPAFLEPGRYMIEVATEERHPLRIRRWVLEVE